VDARLHGHLQVAHQARLSDLLSERLGLELPNSPNQSSLLSCALQVLLGRYLEVDLLKVDISARLALITALGGSLRQVARNGSMEAYVELEQETPLSIRTISRNYGQIMNPAMATGRLAQWAHMTKIRS